MSAHLHHLAILANFADSFFEINVRLMVVSF